MRSYLFLKNNVTSEEVVSHNVLYRQQLYVAHYQVSFYANDYIEKLPNMSGPLTPTSEPIMVR